MAQNRASPPQFSNSEQIIPSLQAIPHCVWLAMAVFELICAVALILPALSKRLATLAPLAALCIAELDTVTMG